MAFKAIFFDLDGTLLPMDQEQFTHVYFKELCKVLAKYGVPAEELVKAVWGGTKAMVKNDGQSTNDRVFWKVFREMTGIDSETVEGECDEFYTKEFHKARAVTGENLLAREAVMLAHNEGRKVILATNPLFPMVGQRTRISWLGLGPEDFELITSYENSRFCKPNPAYYTAICQQMDLAPADCLMIGNDENEDMFAAAAAGLSGYLVTDCLIPDKDRHWEGPRGSFAEMVEMLKTI